MPFARLMRSSRIGLAAATVAASCLLAGPASAATTVLPAGGSGFDTDSEGWSPAGASCSPAPLLCTPEAVYDSGAGNPPGSIAARTTVTVNLLDLFSATEAWSSPRFTVPVEPITGARLSLERAFSGGGLVDVQPKASYTAVLHDLTAGSEQTVFTESLTTSDTTFTPKSDTASVVGGHEYQLTLSATTAQSTVAASAFSGTTNLWFDNVGLSVHTSSGSGAGSGGGGGGSLTDAELRQLMLGSLIGPAVLKGNKLFVKVRCPKKVGRTCRIALQGMLTKRKAATSKRAVQIRKGKVKRVALKVKPKLRDKVAKRKRLLFRERVRAGKARATVFKRLKLVRR